MYQLSICIYISCVSIDEMYPLLICIFISCVFIYINVSAINMYIYQLSIHRCISYQYVYLSAVYLYIKVSAINMYI